MMKSLLKIAKSMKGLMSPVRYLKNGSSVSEVLKGEVGKFEPKSKSMLLAKADKLRDDGFHEDAADLYLKIYEVWPERMDLLVQAANMLKDSGQYDRAIGIYKEIKIKDPLNDDVILQMGHAYKLKGDIDSALKLYEEAAMINPNNPDASEEIIGSGNESSICGWDRSGVPSLQIESYVAIRSIVSDIGNKLDHVRSLLRLNDAFAIYAPSDYIRMTDLWPIPRPPGTERAGVSVTFIAMLDGYDSSNIHVLLSRVASQSHSNWRLVLVGGSVEVREALNRIMYFDQRMYVFSDESSAIEILDFVKKDLSEYGYVQFLVDGSYPHQYCAEWIVSAGFLNDSKVVYFDELHSNERGDMKLQPRSPFDDEVDSIDDSIGLNYAVNISHLDRVLGDICCDAHSMQLHEELKRLLRLYINRQSMSSGDVLHIPLPLIERSAPPPAPTFVGDANNARYCNDNLSIAVIICTRDNAFDCSLMLKSLISKSSRPDLLSFIICDNGSKVSDHIIELDNMSAPNVIVIRDGRPFNWSGLNNDAFSKCGSDIVVFANDDMAMESNGWDDFVREDLSRKEVGIVGAKLIYEDRTIQHAGVLLGWHGSVVHEGLSFDEMSNDIDRRWNKRRCVSAVTGAFMAMKSSLFITLGGFDEIHLPIAYSDIEMCIKSWCRGRKVLFDPFIQLIHKESKSRGHDHSTLEKKYRNEQERRVIESRWPMFMKDDFFVNPIWSDYSRPFRTIKQVDRERIARYFECQKMRSKLLSRTS